VGLDPAQVLLPAEMLAVDLAQVSYEESIFFAKLAGIVVDSLDTGLQGLSNQLFSLCGTSAMIISSEVEIMVRRLQSLERQFVFGGCGS
jgi:hypothetical protein